MVPRVLKLFGTRRHGNYHHRPAMLEIGIGKSCIQVTGRQTSESIFQITPRTTDPFQLPECGRELAERFHGVAVAKDARTVVCKEQGEFYLNTTGNSGMATAGSGDVLTGVILGLLAQGMNAIDAAVNGVYLHGRAGELAAKLHTEYGVMAGDIADCLMKDYDEKESVKK